MDPLPTTPTTSSTSHSKRTSINLYEPADIAAKVNEAMRQIENHQLARVLPKTYSPKQKLMKNTHRRIRVLQPMARVLYRAWFVHLGFPGHETHPHVAFPLGDTPIPGK